MFPSTRKQNTKIGDCETCARVNLPITLEHHNMWMCQVCVDDEKRAITTKIGEANALLEHARNVDEKVQMKPDMFMAKTVALPELRAAIEHDENIPADRKDSVYAQTCKERYLHFKDVVFKQRQELLEQEQEMRMWQVNMQEAASKLKKEEQDKYREFTINYQPTPAKKSKVSEPSGKTKKASDYKRSELAEASKKYGFDVSAIRVIMLQKNMTAENAAKYLVELSS